MVQDIKRRFIFKIEKQGKRHSFYKGPDGMPVLVHNFGASRFVNKLNCPLSSPCKIPIKPGRQRGVLSDELFGITKRTFPRIRYHFPTLRHQKKIPVQPKKVGDNIGRNFREKKAFPDLKNLRKGAITKRDQKIKHSYDIFTHVGGGKVILFDVRQKTIYSFFALFGTFLIAVLYYKEILYLFSCTFLHFHQQYSDFFGSDRSLFVYDKVTGPFKIKTLLIFTVVLLFNLAYLTYLGYGGFSVQLRRTASLTFLLYGSLYLLLFFLFGSFAGSPVIGQYLALVHDIYCDLDVFETHTQEELQQIISFQSGVCAPMYMLNTILESIFEDVFDEMETLGLQITNGSDLVHFSETHPDYIIQDGGLEPNSFGPNTLENYMQITSRLAEAYASYGNVPFKITDAAVVDFLRINILIQMEHYYDFVATMTGVFIILLYLPVILYGIQMLELTSFLPATKQEIRSMAYRYVGIFLAFFEANGSDYLYPIKAIFLLVMFEVFIFFFTFMSLVNDLLAKIAPAYC